jgi:hypothetical protein
LAREYQSFLDNLIAGLAQTGAWNDPQATTSLVILANQQTASKVRVLLAPPRFFSAKQQPIV